MGRFRWGDLGGDTFNMGATLAMDNIFVIRWCIYNRTHTELIYTLIFNCAQYTVYSVHCTLYNIQCTHSNTRETKIKIPTLWEVTSCRGEYGIEK